MMRRFSCALTVSLVTALPAHAALRAWVDNPQVAPGETVRLTLAHDGQTNSDDRSTQSKPDDVARKSNRRRCLVGMRGREIILIVLGVAPRRLFALDAV